ncbi:winged helix-turn-helix domain-containing protein [Mycobacterium sp. PDNC021]|uniref:winged helix-turn-helix domain-containing protein n=1 Tax=Mycobacterium sp. PDNC021 TaxID=3391399 RepID=UPI003AB0C3A4
MSLVTFLANTWVRIDKGEWMYQGRAVRASQLVLTVELPTVSGDALAQVTAMMDEFSAYLAYRVPGARVEKSAVAAGPARNSPPAPICGLVIDRTTRQVSADGRPIAMAYKEFELLAYLAQHPRRIISREELIENVWDAGFASMRTVDTHVRRLRVKLGVHALTLTTVRGKGYRFDPQPSTRFRDQRPIRSA